MTDRYGNITSTRLPWETVWTPDIVLLNATGDGEQGREMRTLIKVDYQGNVTLLTQSIYMSKCKVRPARSRQSGPQIDVTYYPFDTQLCELKFASWTTDLARVGGASRRLTYPPLQLNISIGDISEAEILGLYSPSGDQRQEQLHDLPGVFELKRFWAERHEDKDPCCSVPFADVT